MTERLRFPLPKEGIHRTLGVVRSGIQIGAHLSALYSKASNLEALIEQNRHGKLDEAQTAEFRAKYQTASAISATGPRTSVGSARSRG